MTSQQPLTDPLLGRLIDSRYRVSARIAAGGMATVYLAVDTRLQRRVAVKIMHPHLADDPVFRERFMREALASARLSHPNVVGIYDQGHEDGVWYLVMEYLPGMTLRELLNERGALTETEALDVLCPALAGLSAAHAAGILHRDLKPENILLVDDGRIKIADFGLARAMSAHTAPSQALIGSVAYMSPELISRGQADNRSDIYAMGIILFEMLTGRQPFVGEQAMQVALQHTTGSVPPPSSLRPQLGVELDELVLWATAANPANRPAHARALLEQANDIRAGLGHPSSPAQVTRPYGTAELPAAAELFAATEVLDDSGEPQRTLLLDTGDDPAAPLDPDPSRSSVELLERRSRRARTRGGALLLIVALLAALVGGTGWYFGSGPGAMIAVPDVAGLPVADARAALSEQGLAVAVVDAFSIDVPVGTVIATDPPAGQNVYPEDTVTVTVSQGPQIVAVPDVTGAAQDVATATLIENGFLVSETTTQHFSDKYDAGRVIGLLSDASALSAGDDLAQGSTIVLDISLGAIPTVSGMAQTDAEATLADHGLTVAYAESEYSETVASGVVISQYSANEIMTTGDTVTLVVSKGPELVTVPNVIGDSISDARSTLEAQGFTVDVNAPDGAWASIITVVETDPEAGTQVRKGSTITITKWGL